MQQSRKRGRDDEGNGLLGFLQDSALIEVVDESDLEEDVAPLKVSKLKGMICPPAPTGDADDNCFRSTALPRYCVAN